MPRKRLLLLSVVLNAIFILTTAVVIVRRSTLPHEDPFQRYYYKNYPYWKERNSLLGELSIDTNSIVMVGNSLTDGAEWAELFKNPNVKNRGIGGTTEGLIHCIP